MPAMTPDSAPARSNRVAARRAIINGKTVRNPDNVHRPGADDPAGALPAGHGLGGDPAASRVQARRAEHSTPKGPNNSHRRRLDAVDSDHLSSDDVWRYAESFGELSGLRFPRAHRYDRGAELRNN